MVIGSTGGKLLVATPPLADPNFDRSVIYVLEHDERGALGVVINRPSDEELPDQLAPWRWHVAAPASVFTGGPVEPLAMIGVGQRRDDAGPRHHAGATPSALETIDLTADPHEAGVDRLRIFRGYAGWAPGQLEAELEAGAWLVLALYPDDVFTAEPAELWRTVLRRQGGRLAWLAGAPTDLSMN